MNNQQNDPRSAALYVLNRCRRFDAWSQQTLDVAIHKFALDERNAALCTRLCYSILQNSALCDYYISVYSNVEPSAMEPKVLDILRLGTVQLLFMDRIPASAAVNESVRLVKESGSKASGLVNAVLRRIGEHKDCLPAIPNPGSAEELSIRFSHPRWLCEKLLAEHGYDFAAAFLSENNREGDTALTVNLCRTTRDDLCRMLMNKGIDCLPDANSADSIRLRKAGNIRLLPGYDEGLFFVQDVSAAMAAGMADVKPGMRVLDACAAPGGKSFLCGSHMKNEGKIISCDLHPSKLSRIEEGAQRLGLDCIETLPMDASKPFDTFRNGFDVVIADVPCSGIGVIRKKPEIRYKRYEELRNLPEVQLRILQGISSCVRPGGTLLYSTCTVFSEENEGVISAFLEDNNDFTPEAMRTIWPQEMGSDGFFMCRMKRNDCN